MILILNMRLIFNDDVFLIHVSSDDLGFILQAQDWKWVMELALSGRGLDWVTSSTRHIAWPGQFTGGDQALESYTHRRDEAASSPASF